MAPAATAPSRSTLPEPAAEPPPRPAAWRFVPPNAATAASLVLALLGIEAAVRGRPIEAGWWCLLCTLTDKLDGFFARLLHASSEFGVQLDSLADLVSFGVTPAVVFYSYFSAHPELGWASGGRAALLAAICAAWVIAAAVRLARFNVLSAQGPSRHFLGTPTTMTAGTLVSFFLTCIKYSSPALAGGASFDHWRWLGDLRLDAVVPYLPFTLLLGGASMLSPVRIPKLGRTRHLATDVLVLAAVLFGYGVGILRDLPEYLAGGGIYYYLLGLRYHFATRAAAPRSDESAATV